MITDRFIETDVIAQNNMTKILVYLEPDNLVIGGTCTFVFTFDNFSQALIPQISEIEVFYKDSLSILFTKKLSLGELELLDYPNHILIKSTLNSYETAEFKFNRAAMAQVKFTYTNGTILYGELIPLTVISTIDNH